MRAMYDDVTMMTAVMTMMTDDDGDDDQIQMLTSYVTEHGQGGCSS